MKIRYQADNDLDQRIIDAVMRLVPESQFKTAPEAGFHTETSDSEVLRIAADDGRILVSHDLKTRDISENSSSITSARESLLSDRKWRSEKQRSGFSFSGKPGRLMISSTPSGSSASRFDQETEMNRSLGRRLSDLERKPQRTKA